MDSVRVLHACHEPDDPGGPDAAYKGVSAETSDAIAWGVSYYVGPLHIGWAAGRVVGGEDG